MLRIFLPYVICFIIIACAYGSQASTPDFHPCEPYKEHLNKMFTDRKQAFLGTGIWRGRYVLEFWIQTDGRFQFWLITDDMSEACLVMQGTEFQSVLQRKA